MDTNTKPTGQVKRLVLEIDGARYALDASITKDEALNVLDILSKGLRRTDYVHSPGCYGRADYVGPEAEISLRVHSGPVYESRAEAQAAADAAEAVEKGGAK